MKPSPVKTTIDFEQDGLQHGFLKLPHSHDESAYGSVMIPISMVKTARDPPPSSPGEIMEMNTKARSRFSTWPEQSTHNKSAEG